MRTRSGTATWVIVPAFNEATTIGRVVAELVRHGYAVVVIDDGSADETGARAAAAGATVVTHAVNLGQGAALQTGICYALRQGADYIVTFDADGQHRVGDIAALLAALPSQQRGNIAHAVLTVGVEGDDIDGALTQ